MLNLSGNPEPRAPFEGRSKNAASCACEKGRERQNKSLSCRNSCVAHWSLYNSLCEIMNNDVLPFEINYLLLQASQESSTNKPVPSQISGRCVSRNTVEQIGRKHYGHIFQVVKKPHHFSTSVWIAWLQKMAIFRSKALNIFAELEHRQDDIMEDCTFCFENACWQLTLYS